MNINQDFKPIESFDAKWIKEEITEACIKYLENFGYYLCAKRDIKDRFVGRDAMTTSQIRNVFGAIKQIEAKGESAGQWEKTAFLMLRPKMAYAAARVTSSNQSSRIQQFRDVFDKAHSEVNGDFKRFQRFCQFMEGVVAYHKVYGGKD